MKPQWASDRNLEIFKDLLEGHTMRSIGAKHSISHERVRQICNTIRWKATRPINPQDKPFALKLAYDTVTTEGMRVHRQRLLDRLDRAVMA